MRVTLAYPYEGHEPDETIEVDDDEGRRLLTTGHARKADAETTTKTRPKGQTRQEPDNGTDS